MFIRRLGASTSGACMSLCLYVALTCAPGSAAAEPEAQTTVRHATRSNAFPSHHFQWRAHTPEALQLSFNFGLVQLELGGLNLSFELRWKRLWVAYQHGMWLTLNRLDAIGLSSLGMSRAERDQRLHMYLPYSTGFGAGILLVDELWLGAELTVSRFEVGAPGGAAARYTTLSIGAVIGWRFFVWRGLYAGLYVRYWPTLSSTLGRAGVALSSERGPVVHTAHAFNFYPNMSLGYAFDL